MKALVISVLATAALVALAAPHEDEKPRRHTHRRKFGPPQPQRHAQERLIATQLPTTTPPP